MIFHWLRLLRKQSARRSSTHETGLESLHAAAWHLVGLELFYIAATARRAFCCEGFSAASATACIIGASDTESSDGGTALPFAALDASIALFSASISFWPTAM